MYRRVTLNLLALGFGVILSFILLEVALRIYNPVVQTVKGDTIVVNTNYDERHSNAGIPGVAAVSHIHQNSLGFRGADPPADFADRLTLVTIGGSTTRSAMQSDDATWTALLGQAIAGCFDRSWINNAGMDGHTSIAHIQLMRNYINKLHPKVALLLVGANELYADGLLGHGSDKPATEPALNAAGRAELAAGLQRVGLLQHVKDLLLRSEVVDLGLTFYRSLRAWQAGYSGRTNMKKTAPMPSGGEPTLVAAKAVQSSFAERLRLLISLARDGHTLPVLITQPTFGGPGRDPTTGEELAGLWYGLFWYRAFETYNDTMRRVAADQHVELIDLARLMPKDTKYYIDPMHYTDVGAKEVAQQIAAALLPYLQTTFPDFAKGGCQ